MQFWFINKVIMLIERERETPHQFEFHDPMFFLGNLCGSYIFRWFLKAILEASHLVIHQVFKGMIPGADPIQTQQLDTSCWNEQLQLRNGGVQ